MCRNKYPWFFLVLCQSCVGTEKAFGDCPVALSWWKGEVCLLFLCFVNPLPGHVHLITKSVKTYFSAMRSQVEGGSLSSHSKMS